MKNDESIFKMLVIKESLVNDWTCTVCHTENGSVRTDPTCKILDLNCGNPPLKN